MPPAGIRTGMSPKKNNDELAVQATTSNQENIPPVKTTSLISAAGKATESRKRAPLSESTSEESVSTSEPQRKAKKKIELIIKLSRTDEAEDEEELDFGEGGYYPAKDGQVFYNQYEVQKMLGNGFFATVHMAEDKIARRTVAMKIVKSDERDRKGAEKEIEIMDEIKEASESGISSSGTPTGSKNLVTLLDDFRIKGTHGIHVVMVFEILGMDLYNLLYKSNQRKLSLDRIKKFSRNILEGLHFLHTKCKIMHLDLKPENCLIKVDPDNMDLSDPSCMASLKLGDFGTSEYIPCNCTGSVQTCHYRAPEIFLEAKITPFADIWSVGCTLYEMAARDLLFPCEDDLDTCILKSHFNDISALLGPIKTSFFKKTQRNASIFDEVFGKEKVFVKKPAEINLISPEELTKRHTMTMSEADEYCEFIRELLMINPAQRLSAKEALKHPFFTKGCSE